MLGSTVIYSSLTSILLGLYMINRPETANIWGHHLYLTARWIMGDTKVDPAMFPNIPAAPSNWEEDHPCMNQWKLANVIPGPVIEPQLFQKVQDLARDLNSSDMFYRHIPHSRRGFNLPSSHLRKMVPELVDLQKDPKFVERIAKAAGVPELYPLDTERFVQAVALYRYASDSYISPHVDSIRSDGDLWTVLIGIENTSDQKLVVDDRECPIAENSAWIMRGDVYNHWVAPLTKGRRDVVCMEFTTVKPEAIHWRWQVIRSIQDMLGFGFGLF